MFKGLIRKIYGHHRLRMDRIVSILSEGEKTAFDIAMELFSGLPPFESFSASPKP